MEKEKDGYHEPNWFEDGYNAYELSRDAAYRLINAANASTSLDNTLKRYKVSFDIVHNPNGWTHRSRRCPLPSHKDQTPSFGYNSKDDRFFCFGCKASGKSVEFISLMDGIGKLEAARSILSSATDHQSIEIKVDTSKEVSTILISFSKELHAFLLRHPSKKGIAYMEAVAWTLEQYLASKRNAEMDVENLKKRLAITKRYLNAYKEV